MNAIASSHPQSDGQTLKVLIIDDESIDRERCARFIRQIPNLVTDIVAAEGVPEAEALMRESRFDCVLADYHLPGQTGLEFAGRHLGDSDPPIILLTGNGSETVVLEALRTGVADYLIKSSLTSSGLHRAINNAVEKAVLRNSLRAHTDIIERANLTLKRRNGEIQRFYHSVSHELKTPLTAAREFISLVVDGVAGEINSQQRDFLLHAIDCCDQLSMHFNDLVETTRFETGKLKLNQRGEHVEKVVVRAVFSVSAQASARGITLKRNVQSGLSDAYIDAGRILQVLANLLTNAIKFTHPGGWIELNVTQSDPHWIQISVQDNGYGIEPQHLEHIFERLYQVPRASEHAAGGGLGLGLSIAKEIVELHGGRLHVESKAGHGSTFTFSVPVLPKQLPKPEEMC